MGVLIMNTLIAFHNNKQIKNKYLNRVVAHRKADEIVKGKYWEGGKGCAVGCTIHSSQHSSYEIELGIPTWLARLEDRLFEGVSNKYAKTFPERFLKAIKPGTDLNQIKNEFLYFIVNGTLKHFDHKKYPECVESIKTIGKAFKRNETDKNIWISLKSEAAAAAEAATASAAAYATDAAAYATEAATDAAAYAAEAATASCRVGEREKEYEKMANKLLKLLKGCK